MEQMECSETSVYKIHTLGNYPEESTQHPSSTLLIMHAALNFSAICILTLHENYEYMGFQTVYITYIKIKSSDGTNTFQTENLVRIHN